MKKTFICLFLLAFILVGLVSCGGDQMTEDYANLNKNHIVTKITPEELINKIKNNDDFTVILGFSACPWCQAILPVADEVAKEQNYKELYYCDIKDMRDNAESADRKYYLELVTYVTDAYDTEKDRVNAPTTCGFKDGVLTDWNRDTVSSHVMDETNNLPALTDAQKDELKTIIIRIFNSTK